MRIFPTYYDLESLRGPIPYQMQGERKLYKRSDFWRLRYRVQRYMRYVPLEEMEQRNADIFTNLTTLTAEGQIGLEILPKDDQYLSWMELWIHIFEEYALRGLQLEKSFTRKIQFPKPTAPLPAKGSRELEERRIDPTGKLIKYGNREWLKETWLTGRWRLSSASYYASDQLCAARRDSEMMLEVSIPNFLRHPQATTEINDEYPETLASVDAMNITCETDYYLACFARSYIPRMFDDFGANSCLIVMDEKTFRRRFEAAIAKVLPNSLWMSNQVGYIDPLLPKGIPNTYFAKHFRYSYQSEFRFVVLPPENCERLEPVFIDLGPLTDCCDFLDVS